MKIQLLPLALSLTLLTGCVQVAQTASTASGTTSAPAVDPGTPLAAGARAPDFNATAWTAGQSAPFRLSEALKRGPVVVYFFPAAFTPGCNIEARLFSQAIDRFKAKGATVIGVTAGNTDQLAKFSADNETCSGKFAVAADPGAAIARQYGAILSVKPDWSSRTSFAIGRDGRILKVHSDGKPAGHVEAMLGAL